MSTSLVSTVIGEDRPGLVEAVAKVVADNGGNWVESRMSRLAGRFAGILRVDVADERAASLTSALRALEDEGLRVIVESSIGGRRASDARHLVFELTGQDRAGIVRDISRVLAANAVSVDELDTEVSSAPEGGGKLFRAKASLFVPPAVSTDDLRDMLEEIAADLMVDVVLGE